MLKNHHGKFFILSLVVAFILIIAPENSFGSAPVSVTPTIIPSIFLEPTSSLPDSVILTPTQTHDELPAIAVPDENEANTAALISTPADASVPTAQRPIEISDVVSVAIVNTPLADSVVENELMIRFTSAASESERNDFLQTIGGTITQTITPLNTVVVQVASDVSPQSLPPSPFVLQSEPNYQVSAQQAAPGDSLVADQWALPAINAPTIWNTLPANARRVAIAVIDSGICANHPDLQGRILPGWDFVDNDSTPQDELGHGCAVAGIIAANSDNDIGISGIAPNAQIMPLRVLDKNGIGSYANVAAAIVYAVDNGADILDLSLGGSYASPLLESAIQYAVNHGKTVIAAAGNTSTTDLLYPAAYSSVISVGALDSNLGRSSFSASGEAVKRMLPGQDILTTSLDGNYAQVSGTSFAAAHAVGLKALELAVGEPLPMQLFRADVQLTSAQSESTVPGDVNAQATTGTQSCGVELMLVLDTSGSIDAAEYASELSFAHNIVSSFTVGPNDARIGLVQFSDAAVVESGLVDSADAINAAITNMNKMDGNTNITAGINLGQGQLTNGRAGVPRAMIVLTDGVHNVGSAQPGPAADAARSAGTTVFAVAVGNDVDMAQINAIGGNSANVVSTGDFAGLAKTIQSLVGGACALSIVGVEFKEEHLVLGGWQNLNQIQEGNNFYERTFDGNRVQIRITIENHSNQTQYGSIRILDANLFPVGSSDFKDLNGQIKCNDTQDFPPGQKLIETCFWDTSGYAWNSDGTYNLTQKIVIKVVNATNTLTYDRTRLDDNTIEVWPKPLILVHGIWATYESWADYLGPTSFIRTLHPHWLAFAVDDGQAYQSKEMFTGRSVGYPFKINTLSENADVLASYIESVRTYENAQHVDIVAHSMGGLITRQYIHDRMLNFPTNDGRPVVSHLVTFGTPNAGSACAWLYRFPSTRELRPEFLWEFNTKLVTKRHGIPFYGLAGNAIQLTVGPCSLYGTELDLLLSDYSWEQILLMAFMVSGASDGVVAVRSAQAIPYEASTVVRAFHTSTMEPLVNAVYAPTYFASFAKPRLAVSHEAIANVQANELADSGVPYPPTSLNIPENFVQAVENQQNNQIILTDNIQINPGATVSIPVIGVNGTELGVALIAAPDVKSALHNPSNTEVSKIDAYSTEASQPFRQHLLENPQQGNWSLVLTNQGTTAFYVQYTAWIVDSSVTLDGNLKVLDANRLRIEAAFVNAGAPVLNATVTSSLKDSNETEFPFTLHDDGLNGDTQANDGIYTVITTSLAPGNYSMDIHAQGAGVERFMFTTVNLASADLAVTQTDTPDPAISNSNLTYTVTISNNGPTYATDIVLKNTLPTSVNYLSAEGATCSKSGTLLTCNVGSISDGGSAIVTIKTQVKAGVTGTVNNQAIVSASSPDPDTTNNTVTEQTLISQPAPNDNFSSATVITGIPSTKTQNTRIATSAIDDPVFGCGWQVGRTVWYRYTATTNAALRFTTVGSDFNTVMSIWTGTALTNLARQGCADDDFGLQTSSLDLAVVSGTTYYILVGGYDGASGNLQLMVQAAPPPANDDFNNALNITSLPFTDERNIVAATKPANDPALGATCTTNVVGRSVWYKFISSGQAMEFSTQGSNFDTAISVWTGTLDSLTSVICDDDGGGANTSLIRLLTTSGTTYYVMVNSVGTGRSDLQFTATNITALVPANDDFANASAIISLPYDDSKDTAVTLTNADDPKPTCIANLRGTVWYSYTTASAAPLRFTTTGSNFDTVLSIWTGTAGNLTQVACNDNTGESTTSTIDLTPSSGTTYYIMVGGAFGSNGALQFAVKNLSPGNDDFNNAINFTSLPFTDSRNTNQTVAAVDDPVPNCGYKGGKTVWYEHIALNKSVLRLSTFGSSYDTVLSVWTGARGSLTQQSCNDNFSGNISQIDQVMNAGTTYYIMVAGYNGANGTLEFAASDITGLVSSNDDFDSPLNITSLPYNNTVNNRTAFPAIDDPTPTCQTTGKTNSVWYKFLPASKMVLRLVTQAANFNHALSVWTGTRGSLTQVGCGYASSGNSLQLDVTLNAGTTYYLMLAGVNASGNVVLNASNVTDFVSSNDDFDSARSINSLPFTTNIDNRVAFTALDDPTPTCQTTGKTNSVWYKFLPASKMVLRLLTQNVNFNHTVSLWTGTRGSLTQVGCYWNYANDATQYDLTLNAGTTYYLMVAGMNASGNILLNATDATGLIASNDDFDSARSINSLPFTTNIDNRVAFTALDDPTPTCQTTGKTNSVWYKFVPASKMVLRLLTQNVNFNHTVSLWTGTRDSLTQVGCGYATSGNSLQLDVTLNAGTTYYLMLAGMNASGNILLNATDATGLIPTNDDFDSARSITSLPFTTNIDNRVAFTALDDPTPTCQTTGKTNSVWYKFVPASKMVLRLLTQNVNFNHTVSLWTGTRGSLTQVGCYWNYANDATQYDLTLNAGTTYYLMVAGMNASGNILLNATDATGLIPTNDDFDTAKNITTLPHIDSVNTTVVFSATDDPTPSCQTNGKTNSVWYKFVPSVTGTVTLSTVGSSFNTVLSVWTGTRGSLTQVGCNDNASGVNARLDLAVTSGTTYYIMATGVNAKGDLIFTATNIASGIPSNDDFANADTLTVLPATRLLDTRLATTATTDPAPSCYTTGKTNSVWYKITPVTKRMLRLVTMGANFSRTVSVWTGTISSLTQVGCTYATSTNNSQMDVALNPGTTYYIMVGGIGTSGDVVFRASEVTGLVPTNNDFANAKPISTLPYSDNVDNQVAFPATTDPTPSCYTTGKTNSVWYKITPASKQMLRLVTLGANFSRTVSVWTGTVSSLTQVGCTYASSTNNSQLDVALNPGTTYYIMVAGIGATGSFTFNASNVTGLVPANNDFANAKLISTLPYSDNVDNQVAFPATTDPTPSCYTTGKTNSVWYKITPASKQMLRLVTLGANFSRTVSVWTGTVSSLTQVGCTYASSTNNSQLDVALNAGTTYYIMVAGIGATGSFTFNASNVTGLVPANDDFANTKLISTLPYSDNVDNQVAFPATTDPTPSCYTTGKTNSVWYKITPASKQMLRLVTLGANFSRTVSVWTGTISSLTQVGCTYASSTNNSQLDVALNAGTTYYIMVAGIGATGSFTFNVSDLTPLISANDLFENATLIGSLPFTENINTQLTFPGTTDPQPTCFTNISNTVWYRYTAPTYSKIHLSTLGSSYDTVLSVWVMTNNNLLQVICNDNEGSLISSGLDLQATGGTTYYVMVTGKNSVGGSLQFAATPVGNNQGKITGQVFQTNGTTPIAGAPVWIGGWSAPVCTDTNGGYSITGLTVGQDYTVSAGGDSGPCVVFDYAQEWWQETSSPVSATSIMATVAGVNNINFTLQSIPLEADLSIVKAASPVNVALGYNLDYTVTVTNNGPLRATNVVVTDQLPPQVSFISVTFDNNTVNGSCEANNGLVTCKFSRMPAGKQTNITLHLHVGMNAVSPMMSIVQVTANEDDPILSNNSTNISVLIAAPPLDSPILVSPLDEQTLATGTPTFKWNSVPDATSYELKLGTTNLLSGSAVPVIGTQYVPVSPLWAGKYYWAVRAIGSSGRVSAWSDTWAVNLGSSPNAAPVGNFFTTSTPTLTWSRVSWAVNYQVQVDTDDQFNSPDYDNDQLAAESLLVQIDELPNGIYVWHVRAKEPDDTWGDWSEIQSFVVAQP